MRATLFFLLPFFSVLLSAQTSSVRMGVGMDSNQPNTIANINASDGVYDKFVLIRWEALEHTGNFRLFRALSTTGASMQELTKTWQKSTWFCDYSAEKGRDYYYAVLGSDGKTSTPLSGFDKGFLKKDDKVANDESLSAVTPDKYASGKQIFVLVSDVVADSSTYKAGTAAQLLIGLQNIFDEPTPRTDIRIYLSSDTVWDFDDKLLIYKVYSGFPANMKVPLAETVLLPVDILSGTFHVLVVAAPEGNILNAKTGSTMINISGQ